MAEPKGDSEPSIVERWLRDQQQWQRTLLTYLDSMTKNDEFLIHLGNAMRGSLLAGKPYPTTPAPAATAPDSAADDRLDQILFALHRLEGQMQDLLLALEAQQAGASASGAGTKRRQPQSKVRRRSSASPSRPSKGAR